MGCQWGLGWGGGEEWVLPPGVGGGGGAPPPLFGGDNYFLVLKLKLWPIQQEYGWDHFFASAAPQQKMESAFNAAI